MIFEESFFEDEIREGFYVPSVMKQSWAAQLEVLDVIKNICEKHNIMYFAAYGTLLGAVRHKGFVPWDDDIDIIMKRADFDRFMAVCEQELPNGFKILTYYNHPDFWHFLARVVNSSHACFEPDYVERFHSFPYIAGIDLFIYDYVSDNPDEESFRERLVELILHTCDSYLEGKLSEKDLTFSLDKITELTCVPIDRNLSGRELVVFLYSIAERLIGLFKEENCSNLTLVSPLSLNGGAYRIPKNAFAETTLLPFENMNIAAPIGYNEYLFSIYGDYKTVVKGGSSHTYPCFASQENALLELMDFELPGFIYKKETAINTLENKKKRAVCDNSEKEIITLFVVYKATQWKSIESYYKAESLKSNTYVCVVPYHHKNFDGSYRDTVYEISDFPSTLNFIDYKDLNIENLHANRIYIQNPYDEYNRTYTIEPEYYSVNLSRHTEELIYIPYFTVDEFTSEDSREYYNMRYYVTVPGVIVADKVIVQSENMKALYVKKLSEFLGDNYYSYYQNIICV